MEESSGREQSDPNLIEEDPETQQCLINSPLNWNNSICLPAQDSCFSWFVCFSAVFCNIVVMGCVNCFGIIYPSLLEEFGEGKAKTAWVGSMATAGTSLFGPVAGKLYDLLGVRAAAVSGGIACVGSLLLTSLVSSLNLMYLTYGTLFGLGSSLIYIAIYSIVPYYFMKRRSIAIGLITMSIGGSLAAMSPITQALMDATGWRGTFQGLGCITVTAVILGFVFSPKVLNREQEETSKKQSLDGESGTGRIACLDLSVWKNPSFAIITTAHAFIYIGLSITLLHLAKYSEGLNVSADQTAWLYSSMGLASLLVRVPGSRICDVIGSLNVYMAAVTIASVASFLLPLATSWIWLLCYSIVAGLADGFIGIGVVLTILNMLPAKQRPQGFGFFQFGQGVAILSGPSIGGFLADATSSYHPAFFAAGSVEILGVIVCLIYTFVEKKLKHVEKRKFNESDGTCAELLVVEKMTVL